MDATDISPRDALAVQTGVRKHPVTPLLLVHPDGYTEYSCLDCGRPVSYGLGGVDRKKRWRHYQREMWRPGARERAA